MKFILLFMLALSTHVQAQQTAQNLFSQFQSSLYQIKIIDLESDAKSSIGSGFQVDAQGTMVTNYHVIADYVFFPQKYRVEYLTSEGETGQLDLIDIDVVNDLALLKKTTLVGPQESFNLAKALPKQGDGVFSLGNPHDLGMIVVPGTYNGLKEPSFYQRIHFTGSINPGMSGGPAVNSLGEVIGVNVATAGNQIGFLVPLPRLVQLMANADDSPLKPSIFKTKIQNQLLANQERLFSILSAQEWQSNPLGEAIVPTKVTDYLSCWGDSNSDNPDSLFLSVESNCRLDDQVYIHNNMNTGIIEIQFEWLNAENMGQHRFYHLFAKSITGAGPGNNAGKNDVSSYQCQQDKVLNQNKVTIKTVLCLRGYKEFSSLYDVIFIGATLDHEEKGLISHFTLAGVAQDTALSFTQRFVDALSW